MLIGSRAVVQVSNKQNECPAHSSVLEKGRCAKLSDRIGDRVIRMKNEGLKEEEFPEVSPVSR